MRLFFKEVAICDVFVIIQWFELAFLVELIKCFFIMLNVVDKNNTVRVVDFVLDDAGKESFGFKANWLAVNVECFDTNFGVAWHFAIDFTNTEAAFVVGNNFAFVFNDLGVDEHGKITRGFVFEIAAYYNSAERAVNLNGGKCGTDFVRT